jgi:hypothetical protein
MDVLWPIAIKFDIIIQITQFFFNCNNFYLNLSARLYVLRSIYLNISLKRKNSKNICVYRSTTTSTVLAAFPFIFIGINC